MLIMGYPVPSLRIRTYVVHYQWTQEGMELSGSPPCYPCHSRPLAVFFILTCYGDSIEFNPASASGIGASCGAYSSNLTDETAPSKAS